MAEYTPAPELLEALKIAYNELHRLRVNFAGFDDQQFRDIEQIMKKLAPIIAKATKESE